MKHAPPAVNSFCERHIGVPQPVSLSELLANGQQYEGRAVSVAGYYSHGFEYSALYSDAGVDIYARDYTKASGSMASHLSSPRRKPMYF